ncbi:MAG: hypothetical protein A2X56_07055 [Nitrospirae bacterium GWC2_57_13]|jgi:tetratricopeptide (TPR) repeat protein|nr:MAG: hypothetical protein A2X56_07055 [Nitrospirae bacterium GWC2_57_13]
MKQVIYNLLLTVLLPFLLFGCSRNDTNTKASADAEGSGAATEAKAPYYPGLIQEYESLLVQDPKNLAAIIALGNAYYDSGQWEQAVGVYERALALDPRNADVRSDRGTAYRNMGLPDKAIAEYRATLKYEPGHQGARYHLGVVYAYDKKDYAEAIHVWEDLLRIAPNHPQSESMRSCIVTFRKVVKKDDEK